MDYRYLGVRYNNSGLSSLERIIDASTFADAIISYFSDEETIDSIKEIGLMSFITQKEKLTTFVYDVICDSVIKHDNPINIPGHSNYKCRFFQLPLSKKCAFSLFNDQGDIFIVIPMQTVSKHINDLLGWIPMILA